MNVLHLELADDVVDRVEVIDATIEVREGTIADGPQSPPQR